MDSKKDDSVKNEKNKSVRGSGWPIGVAFSYKDTRKFSEISKKPPLTFNSIKYNKKINKAEYNPLQKTEPSLQYKEIKPDIPKNNLENNKIEISSLLPTSIVQIPNSIINSKTINLFKIFFIVNGLLAIFIAVNYFINMETNITTIRQPIVLFNYIAFMLAQLMFAIRCIIKISNSKIYSKSINLFKIFFIVNGLLAFLIVVNFFIKNIGALKASRAIISSNLLINILFLLLQLTLAILCFYLCAKPMEIITKNSQTMTLIPSIIILLTPKTILLVIWSFMLVFLGVGSRNYSFVLALTIELLIAWYFHRIINKIINTIGCK